MTKILITGANGQIGTELYYELCSKYGESSVVATDIQLSSTVATFLDVTKQEQIIEVIKKNNIDTIYHMAAILSATGEEKPSLAWEVNMNGFWNILEAARKSKIGKIFYPSSIAVFGADVPKNKCPQNVFLHPSTLYGVTKAAGEQLSDYYGEKYGLDVRSIRYPGLISYKTKPGGGTTDYAVDIFYKAIVQGSYCCFVREDTRLPMMYMSDAIYATLSLMEASKDSLRVKGGYNIGAMSFSVSELVSEIKKHIPNFECTYQPDIRQSYADSWPDSIDDSEARNDWGWKPQYDLIKMTEDMIAQIKLK